MEKRQQFYLFHQGMYERLNHCPFEIGQHEWVQATDAIRYTIYEEQLFVQVKHYILCERLTENTYEQAMRLCMTFLWRSMSILQSSNRLGTRASKCSINH